MSDGDLDCGFVLLVFCDWLFDDKVFVLKCFLLLNRYEVLFVFRYNFINMGMEVYILKDCKDEVLGSFENCKYNDFFNYCMYSGMLWVNKSCLEI